AQEAATLFTQLMLERGFLATKAFNPTYAHDDRIVEEYLAAVEEAFAIIARGLQRGTVGEMLKGPVAHTGFARLN
ncbi:MAG: aminotransferase class III-fold pyridoxal phosphate-dependent enzyme, partial [Anaerolineae bacterium]